MGLGAIDIHRIKLTIEAPRSVSEAAWVRNADDSPNEEISLVRPEPTAGRSADRPAVVGHYPVPGLIRRARRIGDLSQRQMARRARVSPATVGRVESGEMMPSLSVFQRLLGTAVSTSPWSIKMDVSSSR